MVQSGTMLLLYVLRCLIFKISEWYHKNKINPILQISNPTIRPNVQEEDESPIQINNNAYNPEISTKKHKIFIIFVYFLAFLPMHLVIWQNDYSYLTEFVFKLFYKLGLSNLIVSAIVPLYFYLTNESLRKFVFEYYSISLWNKTKSQFLNLKKVDKWQDKGQKFLLKKLPPKHEFAKKKLRATSQIVY